MRLFCNHIDWKQKYDAFTNHCQHVSEINKPTAYHMYNLGQLSQHTALKLLLGLKCHLQRESPIVIGEWLNLVLVNFL